MRLLDITSVPGESTDAADWDAFVARQPGGDLVQTTVWGRTKVALGQRTRLTVARVTNGDVLAGAMLVESRIVGRAKVGYVARGPVFGAGSESLMNRMLEEVSRDAWRQGCVLLVVQPPEHSPLVPARLDASGFSPGAPSVAPDATIRLDLSLSNDELLQAMSNMRRRNIRKTMRHPIDIAESSDVRAFHRLHVSSAERQGFTPRSFEYLDAQWRLLRPPGFVLLLLARVDGVPVGDSG